MSKEEKIVVKKIEYNRNGVSGEPFFSVRFTYQDDGVYTKGTKFNLIGIIAEDDVDLEDGYKRFYVVSPKNISDNWRGDQLAGNVIEEIKKYIKQKYA